MHIIAFQRLQTSRKQGGFKATYLQTGAYLFLILGPI